MRIQLHRAWLAAILTVAGAAEIRATTVDTYTFTQTGYQYTNATGTGTLTGSFSGVVEDSGLIELADLQAFTATFSIDVGSQTTTQPVFFSFDTNPGAGGGTLAFVAVLSADLCVGAPAAFGLDACNPSSQPVTGSFFGFFTDVVPTVELVASLGPNDAPPAQSDVPEPSVAVLLGIGLCGLLSAASFGDR